MDELILYLILKADMVSDFFFWLMVMALCSIGVFISMWMDTHVGDGWDTEEQSISRKNRRDLCKSLIVRLSIVVTLSATVFVVCPKTHELAIIFGVPKLLRTEQAKQVGVIGNKLLEKLEAYVSSED